MCEHCDTTEAICLFPTPTGLKALCAKCLELALKETPQ